MSAPVWGCPWHGRVERDPDGSYWLVKAASRIPLAGKLSNAAAYQLSSIGVVAGVGRPGTHLVRRPGHVMPPRTAEQLAMDQLHGHEWLPAAMLSGTDHYLHGTQLGRNRWIYSNADGAWLVSAVVVSLPVIGGGEALPITLELSAVRFGIVGSAGQQEQIGTVTAASGLDTSHGAGWFPASGLRLQSIRSDGAEVILEVGREEQEPSFVMRSGACYYRLSLGRSQDGAWTSSITLLVAASDVYSESISGGDSGAASMAVAMVIDQAPDEQNPERPWIVHGEVLRDGQQPSGDLWAPLDWHSFDFFDGVIEQQRTSHCGYVFDETDVLRAVQCRLRIVHQCAVPLPEVQVSGTLTVTTGYPAVWDDGIAIVASSSATIESQIVAEVLVDGAVVSAVSALLASSRTEAQSHGATGAPYSRTENDATSIQMPGEPFELSHTYAGSPALGWWQIGNLPNLNGLRLWGLAANGTPAPWPGLARDVRCLALLPFGIHGAATVGALRLSNNVWAPAIVWGQRGSNGTWKISPGGLVNVTGLPPAVVGAPVGPHGAGPGGGAYAASTWNPEPIEYDYLHADLVVGGGVF